MKNLKIYLVLVTAIVSLTIPMAGAAEAGSRQNGRDLNHYSQNQSHKSSSRSYSKRPPEVNHKQIKYVRHTDSRYYPQPRVQCVAARPVRYVKPVCSPQYHNHRNRYLYPALIGAGVGLLVLGLTR
ncbi:MAG: hypothetical protein JXR80_09270 [Deltaproteobacteria bacterium]|nr:hypothetical protein [Deltaproteobacteria bacterium]